MRRALLIAAILLLPLMAKAQGTVNDLETDFGARFSASVDKKLMKGLHLVADTELRFVDNFSSLGRWEAGLGVSYKFNKYFKVGGGYTFIEKQNSAGEWKDRHRFYVDGTATLRAGDWRFSLKEKLQLTHREYNNTYEHNPYLLALKSRVKVSYKGFGEWTPYGAVELRNVFNDPTCSATYNTATGKYSNYKFTGYNDAYFNRVRGTLGAEWELSKQHALDLFLLGEYCYDKNLDVEKDGPTLRSLTYDQNFNAAICIGYVFSF